jgi:hypothetical protein
MLRLPDVFLCLSTCFVLLLCFVAFPLLVRLGFERDPTDWY